MAKRSNELVVNAILNLRSLKGFTALEVLRRVKDKYNVDRSTARSVMAALKRCCEFGLLKEEGGRYSLRDASKLKDLGEVEVARHECGCAADCGCGKRGSRRKSRRKSKGKRSLCKPRGSSRRRSARRMSRRIRRMSRRRSKRRSSKRKSCGKRRSRMRRAGGRRARSRRARSRRARSRRSSRRSKGKRCLPAPGGEGRKRSRRRGGR